MKSRCFKSTKCKMVLNRNELLLTYCKCISLSVTTRLKSSSGSRLIFLCGICSGNFAYFSALSASCQPRLIRKKIIFCRREHIDSFIDENKALIRRMFGEYNTPDDGLHPDARDHYATYSGASSHKRSHRSPRSSSKSYTSNK